MKKLLIGAVILSFTFSAAFCQMPYTLSVLQEAYQPLSGATSINNNISWGDTNAYSVPLGFDFSMGDKTASAFHLSCRGNFISDTPGRCNMFFFSGAALNDRSFGGNPSLSPIRYLMSGNSGNQIFKAEFFNTGFADGLCSSNEVNDSANMQVWLYENSNIIEFHYGPSYLPDSSCFFTRPYGPLVYYIQNDTIWTGAPHHLSGVSDFIVSGDPANPTFYQDDSTIIGLSSFPVNGTVYRFSPSSTGISKIQSVSSIKVYPNPATDFITIENAYGSSVIILNTLGQVAYSSPIWQDIQTISIKHLSVGVYFLQVVNKDGSKETRKVLKE